MTNKTEIVFSSEAFKEQDPDFRGCFRNSPHINLVRKLDESVTNADKNVFLDEVKTCAMNFQ